MTKENKRKNIIILSVVVFVLTIILGISTYLILSKKQENVSVEKTNIISSSDKQSVILENINSYQEKYFEIIKRHNALLVISDDKDAMKDLIELKELFKEVKSKINRNNKFLQEYENIKTKYKENKGKNTVEMNEFASLKYKAFDKLLNDIYQELKAQLPADEFEKLKASEKLWLKEVENYNKIFEAQDYGTIAPLVKFDYEINMRGFRTLLLILYLNDADTKLEAM